MARKSRAIKASPRRAASPPRDWYEVPAGAARPPIERRRPSSPRQSHAAAAGGRPAHRASCVKVHCLSSLSAAALSLTTYSAFFAITNSYCFTASVRATLSPGSTAALALLSSCCARAAAMLGQLGRAGGARVLGWGGRGRAGRGSMGWGVWERDGPAMLVSRDTSGGLRLIFGGAGE